MKKIRFLVIFIYFFPIYIYAQSNNQLESLIKISLTSYIENIKEFQEKVIQDAHYFDNLYINIDNYPPHFTFADSISCVPVKYISLINYSKYHKLLKNEICLLFLNKLELDNNKLTIVYSLKKVRLKKKNHLFIALSDYASFTYKYSCDSNEWILIETKYGGI